MDQDQQPKVPYEKPRLVEYGSIADNTFGINPQHAGGLAPAGSSGPQHPNFTF